MKNVMSTLSPTQKRSWTRFAIIIRLLVTINTMEPEKVEGEEVVEAPVEEEKEAE